MTNDKYSKNARARFLRVLSFFCTLAYNKTNDNELEEFS